MSGDLISKSSGNTSNGDGYQRMDGSGGSTRKNRLIVVSDDEDNQGSHVNVAFEPASGTTVGTKATQPTMNNNDNSGGSGGGDGREFHTYLEEIVSIPDPNSTVRAQFKL